MLPKVVIPLAALALCALPAAMFAEPPKDRPRGPYEVPLLPRIELLKILGAGQRPLVTDYFWLQAIQSAGKGAQLMTKERWLDLYYYADLVTDLDPKFKKVYVFAGTAIPTNLGRERYVNVDEGLKILKKGMDAFPQDPYIAFYYAVNLSYLKKQHREAAGILAQVARMPNAPPQTGEIATRLLAVNGDFEAAMSLITAAERTEKDPKIRETLKRRRIEVLQERVLQKVDEAIEAYKKDYGGKLPEQGLTELLRQGYLDAPPADPMRGIIYIGTDGKAYSSAAEERYIAVDSDYKRRKKYGDNQ